MPDPFRQHGVEYLSPSALGRFQDDPAYGMMQLFPQTRVSDPPGVWAARGTAIDRALTSAAYNQQADDETILAFALRVYDDEMTRIGLDPESDEVKAERENVPLYVRSALPEIRRWGPPEQDQCKVELRLDGIEVPLIGYYDLRYPARITDMKTTTRMPGKPEGRHARQVSVYGIAAGREPWLTYIGRKEVRSFPVRDVRQRLAEVGGAVRAIRSLLAVSADHIAVLRCTAPNYDAFVWRSETARERARDLWGY